MKITIPITFDLRLVALALVLSMSGTALADQPIGNGAPSTGGTGTVTSVSSGDSTLTVANGTTTPDVRLATTQPNANTWTLGQTFTAGYTNNGAAVENNSFSQQFNATTNCGTSGVAIAEMCVIGTSTNGILIGPSSGVWSGGSATVSSQQLQFCKSVSGTVTCPEGLALTSGGTMTFLGGSTISTNNSAFTTGTGVETSGTHKMGATCALSAAGTMPTGSHACKLTFTGITSMVVTFPITYGTQAICFAQDETTTNGAKVTACGTGSATVTATASDVVDFMVTGA